MLTKYKYKQTWYATEAAGEHAVPQPTQQQPLSAVVKEVSEAMEG